MKNTNTWKRGQPCSIDTNGIFLHHLFFLSMFIDWKKYFYLATTLCIRILTIRLLLNNVIFFSEENQVFLDPLFVLSNFLLLRWKLRKMMTLFQRDSVVTLQLYLHYSSFILQWLLLLAILFKQIGMAPYMSLKFIDNHRFMTFQKFITLLIFFELAYFT